MSNKIAAEFGLIVVSTKFQHKEIHKGTWLAPNKKYVNQIDHVLIQKQHTKKVIDVRSYQGADADTDHFLVIATFKQSQNKKRKGDTREYHQIKLNELQEPQIKEKYEKEVEKILAQTEQENIHSRWKQIEDAMTEAAEKTIPQRKENQKVEWFDEECRIEMIERRESKLKMLQTNKLEDKRKFEEQRRKTKKLCRTKKRKKLCRTKKRKYIENRIKQIEQNFQNKVLKNFYQEVKKNKTEVRHSTPFIKDREGNVITNEIDILDRWRVYFHSSEMLQRDDSREAQEECGDQVFCRNLTEEEIQPPTLEEIGKARMLQTALKIKTDPYKYCT
ncbi:hypothetical protein QE152_g39128 [Popillia japonica]|uniref:Craniofacial development protein 2-like n=1 Tax=Popillia japonica TaxID=7064 RepID=A0AAW1HUW4_POPJA